MVLAILCAATVASSQSAPLEVWGLAASPDGKSFVSAHRTSEVLIWDLPEGKLSRRLKSLDAGCLLARPAYSPTSRRIAVGVDTPTWGHAVVWDLNTGLEEKGLALRSTQTTPIGPEQVGFSADSRIIYGVVNRPTPFVAAWRMTTGKLEYVLRTTPEAGSGPASLAVAPRGGLTAIALGRHVELWDPEPAATTPSWTATSFQAASSQVSCLSFSWDAKSLAIVSEGESGSVAQVFRAKDQVETAPFALPIANVRAATLSPDGRRLYVGGLDGVLAEVDATNGEVLRRWKGHEGRHIRAMAVTPTGRTLITGAGGYGEKPGGSICLWSTASGSLLHTLVPR